MTIPLLFGQGAAGEHQVRTVDPLHFPAAAQVAEPHERHPVRRDEPRTVVDSPELFVLLALHHAVHAADAHVMRLTRRDPVLDGIERQLHVDRAHTHAQDVRPLDRRTSGNHVFSNAHLPDRRKPSSVTLTLPRASGPRLPLATWPSRPAPRSTRTCGRSLPRARAAAPRRAPHAAAYCPSCGRAPPAAPERAPSRSSCPPRPPPCPPAG